MSVTTICSPPQALPERELFLRCRAGDAGAREQLIVRFLPAACQIARRYVRSGEAVDDLYQVAAIGLLKAVDRFDVERGIAFWAYATPTILGELKRHFRDYTWAVRVPRNLCDLALLVHSQSSLLSEALGRDATIAELADAVGAGETQVIEALRARAGYSALSLDAPGASAMSDAPDTLTLADSLGVDEHGFEHAEQRALLAPLMPELSPRDREILHMRFEQDLTQTEIAVAIGVSQVHISRIIRQALGRLRAAAAGGHRPARRAAGAGRIASDRALGRNAALTGGVVFASEGTMRAAVGPGCGPPDCNPTAKGAYGAPHHPRRRR